VGENFFISISAGIIAAVITTGGILTVRRFARWAERSSTYFMCFAAGVLLAVSFLHLMPRSLAMNTQAPIYLFGGYLLMYVINRFLAAYVCDKPETAGYALGLVPLFGIGLHSLLDGVIFSIGFSVSLYTGALAVIGIILHEFPEGIVVYTLLVRSGFSDGRAFALGFLAAALTTPVGTLISYPFVSQIEDPFLGGLLAISAGTLIYVGATHLLPQAERETRRFNFFALAAGVFVALIIIVTGG
jgi:zinc and cadmium transporter